MLTTGDPMNRYSSLITTVVAASIAAAPLNAKSIFSSGQLTTAEPLVGKPIDKCMDDPTFLLSIAAPYPFAGFVAKDQVRAKTTAVASDCQRAADYFRALRYDQMPEAIDAKGNTVAAHLPTVDEAEVRRNETVDALIAVSNQKCSVYSAYLRTFDGNVNASLGIAALITGGLGAFVGGAAAAKALSGTSAIINGSRSTINETWFSNQTIHVLAAAFEKARERERREITNRQACPIKYYTTMHAIGDALRYHADCSLLVGLAETSQAVARSEDPGLAAMRRQLSDIYAIRAQVNQLHRSRSARPRRRLLAGSRPCSTPSRRSISSASPFLI